MRRAVLAIAIMAVAGAVFWSWASGLGGEQMFAYGIRNDSNQTVIVQFGSFGRYEAPPGASGRAASSWGYLSQDIEIRDQQCRLLQSVEATTHSAVLWIRDAAPATLNEVPWGDLPDSRLNATDSCETVAGP